MGFKTAVQKAAFKHEQVFFPSHLQLNKCDFRLLRLSLSLSLPLSLSLSPYIFFFSSSLSFSVFHLQVPELHSLCRRIVSTKMPVRNFFSIQVLKRIAGLTYKLM